MDESAHQLNENAPAPAEEIPEPVDRSNRYAWIILCVVVLLWLAWVGGGGKWAAATFGFESATTDPASKAAAAGQFGDLFGGLNALFTALAFAAVAWSAFSQRHEMALQRRELQLQRQELAAQRGEMQSQRAVLQEHARAAAESSTLASEALERSRRPFLVVARIDAVGGLKHPSEGANQVTVRVENFGNVHAFVEAFGATWELGPVGIPLGHAFAAGRAPINTPVIGPRAWADLVVDTPLGTEIFEGQVTGKVALRLHGFVQYRSPAGFGFTRRFHWIYGTHGDGFVPDPGNPVNFLGDDEPTQSPNQMHRAATDLSIAASMTSPPAA
jgi:hypothetical protein